MIVPLIRSCVLSLLLGLGPALLEGRPVEKSIKFQMLDLSEEPATTTGTTALSAANAGTTFFGGTFWNADSSRWQAIRDSVWTFDSGVGSHFDHTAPHVNPFKDKSLHAYMEGWVGFDASYQGDNPYFRRISDTDPRWTGEVCVRGGNGMGSNTSFWCGVFEEEANQFCYSAGQGYGNSWNVCIRKPLVYSGGSVALEFDYSSETEPGFDFAQVVVDTAGLGDHASEVIVIQYDGQVTGHDSLTLSPGMELPSTPGNVYLKFCFVSDGAWSDQDGQFDTACGAFAVDNIQLSGGIIDGPATFETNTDGWDLAPAQPGPGGEWSHLAHLDDLPPYNTTCSCNLSDSVLVFEDLIVGGHNEFQDNLAASPWIDLRAEGLDTTPGKVLEYNTYMDLPVLNYIFPQQVIQWYPEICPATGKAVVSHWQSTGFFYYGVFSHCTSTRPIQVDFSAYVSPNAEQIRVALGLFSYCRFFSNCSGVTNSTPWYDDVRFGVYGFPAAPLIAPSVVDIPQDSFPQDGTLGFSSPGRIDSNNVRGQSQPEIGTALADTLIVNGGGGDAEVYVQFAISPGPGIDPVRLVGFYSKVTFEETRNGLDWYVARMDTAELGASGAISGTWMTAFHEDDPGFSGTDVDTDPNDLDPYGRETRLANDIFPDDLLTPGSRLMLFYKSRFMGGTAWYTAPDTTGGNYYEMEVLPSSYAADSTFNCVLYVDHADGRPGQELIEEALSAVLPGGSQNFENTAWDRWDVRAPSSQKSSFGRPLNTQYGAAVVQTLGYRSIIWNSGRLNAFCLTKEDADVLIPWLTLAGFGGNSLYLSGDGIARSMWEERASEPSAGRLLEELAGVSLVCGTFRDQDCPPGTPEDWSECIELDPVVGAVVSTRPLGATPNAQGNGCPDLRSFDVLQPNSSTDYGSPVPEEQYVGEKTGEYASISNLVVENPHGGSPMVYRTVVDGLSLHHRRDPGECVADASSPPLAIEGRLQEVMDWFGYPEIACSDRVGTIGIVKDPAPRKHITNLLNASPNPLGRSTTARIAFTLAEPSRVSLTVFDLQGRRVATLFEGDAAEGITEAFWDGTDESGRRVASGVYFYRFRTKQREFTRKLVVIGN